MFPGNHDLVLLVVETQWPRRQGFAQSHGCPGLKRNDISISAELPSVIILLHCRSGVSALTHMGCGQQRCFEVTAYVPLAMLACVYSDAHRVGHVARRRFAAQVGREDALRGYPLDRSHQTCRGPWLAQVLEHHHGRPACAARDGPCHRGDQARDQVKPATCALPPWDAATPGRWGDWRVSARARESRWR